MRSVSIWAALVTTLFGAAVGYTVRMGTGELSISDADQVLSPSQTEEAARLTEDIESVRAKIADAETDTFKLEGGLLKAIIAMRLETLRQTEAMLDQKLQALRVGAKYSYSLELPKPDLERVERLNREIGAIQAKLMDAELQAARTGGLIGVMSEATAATHRQSLAMLEQATLVSKYGLSVPVLLLPQTTIPEGGTEPGAIPAAASPARAPATPDIPKPRNLARECIEHVGQDAAIIERNDVYVQYAWKVELKNKCDNPLLVSLDFAFIDNSDFEIEVAHGTSAVGPNSTGLIRGRTMVSPPAKARNIAKTEARWRVQ